ncbi:hypothetical protein CWO33_23885 [Vibrio splendidus]|uniref:mCpol domain-containing protein n=1 Tax=Vibrio splendidus TaxID=29497 RepID=UPI000D346B78|nr:mCpol domain-containing protein [Vibrio splendidus]PTQ03945.1 hypothetical protein CWO33_23885 [Vibrio splendidus]CAH6812958.1 mCpol domain-containing protein [Vibrio chagasii]CAH7040274.1 mCpol domain-containing protein [Vibrio chagasii]
MNYITIDGDDIGRRITSCYLNADEKGLKDISLGLKAAVENVADLLKSNGFEVIFCAADGVLAKTHAEVDYEMLFSEIQSCSTLNITFSAGVGDTLQSAYVALLDSKSSGKNQIKKY